MPGNVDHRAIRDEPGIEELVEEVPDDPHCNDAVCDKDEQQRGERGRGCQDEETPQECDAGKEKRANEEEPMLVDDVMKNLIVLEMSLEEMRQHVVSVAGASPSWYTESMARRDPSGILPEERHGFWYNVFDVLLNVLIIVAAVAVIRTFLFSPFEVEGMSMVPTLHDNEYIIINKIGYIVGEPKRGDVVVFHPPEDGGQASAKYYVKRIIGLPGDAVTIRGGKVYLEREDKEIALDEPYLDAKNRDHTFRAPVGTGDGTEERYAVPDGHYFLLGDNRQGSLDSRSFADAEGKAMPYVAESRISGRVWIVALPITKSHALATPEYAVE